MPHHSRSASLYCLIIACLLGTMRSTLAAVDFEPYETSVLVTRAQVRSGPGDEFYPTSTLPEGEVVEVYREAPGGWLAIRPPRDSFSWVFGRHLSPRADGLAEVDKGGVASRIGSQFSTQRNAAQIQLRKGEIVEVIGEEELDGEKWYKIAPPAGEFRWIHRSQVGKPRRDAKSEVITAAAEADVAPDASDSAVPDEAAASSDVESWRAAPPGEAPAPRATEPANEAPAPPGKAIDSKPAPAADTSTQAAAPVTPDATLRDAAPDDTSDLARQLAAIELRLSRMVAAPTSQWNTELLERDIDQLLAQARTAADREAILKTSGKIDQFKAIGARYQQVAAGTATPPITPIPGTPVAPQAGTGYDAVGVLRPVVSKRPGAPQFALVDERGQVISFVTPTPDMNLQPFIGRRVGVVGNRGFIEEFRRAHVTAGRVVPLPERLLR